MFQKPCTKKPVKRNTHRCRGHSYDKCFLRYPQGKGL